MVLAGDDAGLRLGEIIALEWRVRRKCMPYAVSEHPVRAAPSAARQTPVLS